MKRRAGARKLRGGHFTANERFVISADGGPHVAGGRGALHWRFVVLSAHN